MVKAAKKSSGATDLSDAGRAFRVDFATRLVFLLDRFDSRKEAADVAECTPEQLGRYVAGARGEGGTAKIPFGILTRLAQAKGVSLDWLATGEGAQRIGEHGDGDMLVSVPVWDITASSGPGRYVIDEELRGHLAFSRAWLLSLNVPLNDLHVVFNSGNSNAPVLNDGDAMLVQRGVERLIDDAFYILESDGVLLVKALERRSDGSVVLKSRNPEHEPEVISREKVSNLRVFGRVVGAAGMV